jgi:hypothetical protein
MGELTVIYHIATLGNWREVVDEQLQLASMAGLNQIFVTLATEDILNAIREVRSLGDKHRITLISGRSGPLNDYECPAMLTVQEKVRETNKPVLYFHTKGVSAPHDQIRTSWRRVMGDAVIGRWRENLAVLYGHDAVGVNWFDYKDIPHFSGNFWIATADWIKGLPDFLSYYRSKPYTSQIERDRRLNCEFWIGSNLKTTPRIVSLVCNNRKWWEGPPRQEASILQ